MTKKILKGEAKMNYDSNELASLEGKEVDYEVDYEGTLTDMTLVVIGCDYDIGLTMALKGDLTDNYICLNGKSSPNCTPKTDLMYAINRKVYAAMFDHIVKGIKKGRLVSDEISRVKGRCIGQLTASSSNLQCAFSQ